MAYRMVSSLHTLATILPINAHVACFSLASSRRFSLRDVALAVTLVDAAQEPA
jgi:hypothetical protein